MSDRAGAVLAVVVLAAVTAVVYSWRLAEVPPHVMHDEIQFALQAESIAATGRDLDGRLLPVYFVEPEFPAGRDPAIIYLTAAVLKLVRFGEDTVRLATALVGTLDVVLLFLVARALIGSTPIGLMAAGLLALTPAHFIRARLVLSPLYSIPFILLCLWMLVEHERRPSPARILLAGAWLGLGMYTYLACVIMMPLYLAGTLILVLRGSGTSAAALLLAGFAAVLVPMAIWHVTHPDRLSHILGSYREFSTAPAALSIAGLQARAAAYWSFFDPSFLFVSGDSSLVNSTRRAGFFPAAFALLIPAGLYWIARSRRPMFWLIGAGFLLAPSAAVVSGAIEMNRVMFAIPFGVLVACIGATMMLRAGGWARWAVILLLASIPIQFLQFHGDYYTRYRDQAGPWFGGDIRTAFSTVIAATPGGGAAKVYVSRQIPFAQRYWRFYSLEAGRPDMIGVPEYFTALPESAPAGARLVCASASSDCQAVSASSQWTRVSAAASGPATFEVFVKEPAP